MISIAMATYNGEKYLARCLDSIVAQTFSDWECILVDDGSCDNSGKICDEYAVKDTRFCVIHQQNAGVSVARNAGLKAAKGEWIAFVDSDDWIDPNTYEVAVKTAFDNGADLVQWRWAEEIDGASKANVNAHTRVGVFKFEDSCLYCESRSMCNKIVSRGLLSFPQVRFSTDLKLLEDTFVSFQVLVRMQRGYQLDNKFYHYFMNPASATHNINYSIILNQVEAVEKIVAFLNESNLSKTKNVKRIIKQLKIEPKEYALMNFGIDYSRTIFPEVQKYTLFRPRKITLLYWLIFFHMDFIAVFIMKLWKKTNEKK